MIENRNGLPPETYNDEQEDEDTQAQEIAEEALQPELHSPLDSQKVGGGIDGADTQDLIDHMRDMEQSGRIDMSAYKGEPNMDDEDEKYGEGHDPDLAAVGHHPPARRRGRVGEPPDAPGGRFTLPGHHERRRGQAQAFDDLRADRCGVPARTDDHHDRARCPRQVGRRRHVGKQHRQRRRLGDAREHPLRHPELEERGPVRARGLCGWHLDLLGHHRLEDPHGSSRDLDVGSQSLGARHGTDLLQDGRERVGTGRDGRLARAGAGARHRPGPTDLRTSLGCVGGREQCVEPHGPGHGRGGGAHRPRSREGLVGDVDRQLVPLACEEAHEPARADAVGPDDARRRTELGPHVDHELGEVAALKQQSRGHRSPPRRTRSGPRHR